MRASMQTVQVVGSQEQVHLEHMKRAHSSLAEQVHEHGFRSPCRPR